MVRLREQLDSSRGHLQRSLREASDAQQSEVGHFEAEIRAERQRLLDISLEESISTDRLAQLRDSRERLASERNSARTQAQVEVGRCAALAEELRRLRGEVVGAEARASGSTERAARSEERCQEVKAEGERRAQELRGRIEEIWSGLRSASAGLKQGALPTEAVLPAGGGAGGYGFNPPHQ